MRTTRQAYLVGLIGLLLMAYADEGNILDHFAEDALPLHLGRFDLVLADHGSGEKSAWGQADYRESARVSPNGQDLDRVWMHPFMRRVQGALQPGENVLGIEVTNLAANRIADLDRRGVQ